MEYWYDATQRHFNIRFYDFGHETLIWIICDLQMGNQERFSIEHYLICLMGIIMLSIFPVGNDLLKVRKWYADMTSQSV